MWFTTVVCVYTHGTVCLWQRNGDWFCFYLLPGATSRNGSWNSCFQWSWGNGGAQATDLVFSMWERGEGMGSGGPSGHTVWEVREDHLDEVGFIWKKSASPGGWGDAFAYTATWTTLCTLDSTGAALPRKSWDFTHVYVWTWTIWLWVLHYRIKKLVSPLRGSQMPSRKVSQPRDHSILCLWEKWNKCPLVLEVKPVS